jgi:hypothetical protein
VRSSSTVVLLRRNSKLTLTVAGAVGGDGVVAWANGAERPQLPSSHTSSVDATTSEHPLPAGVAAAIGQTAGKILIFLGARGLIRTAGAAARREYLRRQDPHEYGSVRRCLPARPSNPIHRCCLRARVTELTAARQATRTLNLSDLDTLSRAPGLSRHWSPKEEFGCPHHTRRSSVRRSRTRYAGFTPTTAESMAPTKCGGNYAEKASKKIRTPATDPGHGHVADLVTGDFTAAPDRFWVADFTHLATSPVSSTSRSSSTPVPGRPSVARRRQTNAHHSPIWTGDESKPPGARLHPRRVPTKGEACPDGSDRIGVGGRSCVSGW